MPCALSSDIAVFDDVAEFLVLTTTDLSLISSFYQQLSKDPNIVIAKMDATANDVPSPYEVRG